MLLIWRLRFYSSLLNIDDNWRWMKRTHLYFFLMPQVFKENALFAISYKLTFIFHLFSLSLFFIVSLLFCHSITEGKKHGGEKEETKKGKNMFQCSVKKGGKEKSVGLLMTKFLQNFQSLLQNFQPVVQRVGNILQSWTLPYVMVKHKPGLWVTT